MIHTDAEADLAELLALLGDDEDPVPDTSPEPAPRSPSMTRILPGPPVPREGMFNEVVEYLRQHGVVSSNHAVEVLRAAAAMVNDSDDGRRNAECLIAAIAGRAGLKVRILNGTVFPDGSAEEPIPRQRS